MTPVLELPDAKRVWFSSDHHFGHANIIKYSGRPFASVEEMNEGLVQIHNARVTALDTFILVGDVTLNTRHLEWASKLKGNKFLCPGNHDKCWTGHKKVRPSDIKLYEDAGFTVLKDEVVVLLAGKQFLMCHLPYQGDHRDQDRYLSQRPKDNGLPLICGHVHELWQTQGRMFNVGVDVNGYGPVRGDMLLDWRKSL